MPPLSLALLVSSSRSLCRSLRAQVRVRRAPLQLDVTLRTDSPARRSMLASSCLMILGSALCAGAYGAGGSTQGMFAALIVYRFIAGVRQPLSVQSLSRASWPSWRLSSASLGQTTDLLGRPPTARHWWRVPEVRLLPQFVLCAGLTSVSSPQRVRRVERGHSRGGHRRPCPKHALCPQHQHRDRRRVSTRPRAPSSSSSRARTLESPLLLNAVTDSLRRSQLRGRCVSLPSTPRQVCKCA